MTKTINKSSRKNLRVAVQADPLLSLDINFDSTLAMMRAALKRGYKVFFYDAKDLSWHNDRSGGKLWARGAWIRDWPETAPWPTMSAPEMAHIGDCDVVLLRQDPPFDMAYITSTYLLEMVSAQTLVVNDPRAVRDAPEKLFITRYPDLLPPTFISGDANAIDAFRAQHGAIVLKPLYSHGGKDVVRIAPETSGAAIGHYLSHQGKLPCIAQKFIPAVAEGDKRVILINGVIVAAYRRVPKPGDFRANVSAGASIEAIAVTPRERKMVGKFSRTLVENGILFAGIDVIGDYIVEVNVTSPTSFLVADELGKLKGPNRCAERFWDAIEQRLVLRKL